MYGTVLYCIPNNGKYYLETVVVVMLSVDPYRV